MVHVKNTIKISYITLLWLLLIVAPDKSTEVTKESQVVILGLNHFEWTDKNFSAPAYYPWRIFDAQRPLVELPTLQYLAAGVTTDQELISRVISHYRHNKASLGDKWQEKNDARVQALYAMNVIHLSHPYGAGKTPGSFVEYVHGTPVSSCRVYAIYQSRILDAFGLQWRYVAISSGFHGWIEVKIDGQWEIFDSTANVWIDHSAFALLNEHERQYRLFYTPWTDVRRPDARQFVKPFEPHYFQAGALRMNMPGFGIYFMTRSYLQGKGFRVEVWSNFCPGASKGLVCLEA